MTDLTTKFNSGVSSPPIGSPGRTVMSNANDTRRKPIEKTRICTWNVKTLAKSGKLENALQEMNRMNINIMGISEMRWLDSGIRQVKTTLSTTPETQKEFMSMEWES
uniref:Craniofacial development protein 2-like n=1 Tax=Cacopsylla melanoneura TaxID=428564 RepID=A0A8D9BCK2_9HEMI